MNYQDLFDNQHDSSFRKHTEETRAKISASRKESMTAEIRANISAHQKGSKRSEEARANMSAGQKGKKFSAEGYAKILAGNSKRRGVPLTEEHKANLRAAKAGKTPHNVRPVMTPKGLFSNKTLAAEHYNVIKDTISVWMKKFPNQYYYITK